MGEITKLYENCEIKPTYTDECQMADSYYSMEKDLNKRGILFDDYMKQNCPNKNEACYETCPYAYNKEFYPPFTAEKQIELIKWIAKTRPIHITFLIDKWVIEGMVRYGKRYDTFEDALSGYINSIWKDLSEEEKQQVKGILE